MSSSITTSPTPTAASRGAGRASNGVDAAAAAVDAFLAEKLAASEASRFQLMADQIKHLQQERERAERTREAEAQRKVFADLAQAALSREGKAGTGEDLGNLLTCVADNLMKFKSQDPPETPK